MEKLGLLSLWEEVWGSKDSQIHSGLEKEAVASSSWVIAKSGEESGGFTKCVNVCLAVEKQDVK